MTIKRSGRRTGSPRRLLGLGFPSLDDIKAAIAHALEPIGKAIGAIPKAIRDAARRALGPLVDGVTRSVDTVRGAVDGALTFVTLVVAGYQRWNANAFRQRLEQFFKDLVALSEEPGRILLDLKIAINTDFIDSIVKGTPAIVLYPLARGLDSIPGWDRAPATLCGLARQIPSLNGAQQEVCETLLSRPDLAVSIRDAQLLARMLDKTLDLAISLLPKDLSVNVSVLGEGAGTEVAGHPAKVPFETAKWIVGLADQAFTAYLTRYGACAQSAYQRGVMETLQKIEAAVTASR